MTRGSASLGEVGPAASRDDRADRIGRPAGRQQRGAGARAGAEVAQAQVRGLGTALQPVGRGLEPVGQERDVEDLRAVVGLVFLQQVQQEGREAGLLQDLATYWLRGLNRPLPLPCAKTTTAEAPRGWRRVPRIVRPPVAIATSCSSKFAATG